jgi:uncharacterized protein (DUF362 family)
MSKWNELLGRREFLKRSLEAGLSIGLAGTASLLLYDREGPQPGSARQEKSVLPDFSVKLVDGRSMCVVKGPDRKKSLEAAIGRLGGIERFIKPGETVVIKPNIAFASSPDLGATTHPDIVGELVRLCRKAGAGRIIVLDNPINDPASCFFLSGIEKASRDAGAEIIMPTPGQFRMVSLPNGRLIKNWPVLFEPLRKAHKLIGVAPLKSHHRSGASMTMKNWYGLLGGRRNIFHQDIHAIIAELAMLVKPTLVILDGVSVMTSNGPTGGSPSDLKNMDTIIVSCDQVAADAFGAGLLNLTKYDLPYITMAEKAGAGISDYRSLKPIFIKAV